MWKITLDKEKCSGCGECVDGCPGDVYELQDGKTVVVNPDECHGCHSCEELCDEEAVSIDEA